MKEGEREWEKDLPLKWFNIVILSLYNISELEQFEVMTIVPPGKKQKQSEGEVHQRWII